MIAMVTVTEDEATFDAEVGPTYWPELTRRLAGLFEQRFVERRDVKALQAEDGSYCPDRSPFTTDDVCAHLHGTATFGHYLLNPADQCRLFAFDIDLATSGWLDDVQINPRAEFADPASQYRERLEAQLLGVAERLARLTHEELQVPVAAAFSGSKGVHVYGFTGTESASVVRDAALDLITVAGSFEERHGRFEHESQECCCQVEVFPKQSSLAGKELGNLMRLPLGLHQKSRRSGFFVRLGRGCRGRFVAMSPFDALDGVLPWEGR